MTISSTCSTEKSACICTHALCSSPATQASCAPSTQSWSRLWCSTSVLSAFFKDMAASIRRHLLIANLSHIQFTIYRKFSSLHHPQPSQPLNSHTIFVRFSQPGETTVDIGFLLHSSPTAICLLSLSLYWQLLSPRLLVITLLLNSKDVLKC